ncbi:MAG: GAF domain-containing protein, partial [Candidatus Omnitrophica bacterium]|nr:GAF domain-containing protein [Candidatus Omnitrophota bacterium]
MGQVFSISGALIILTSCVLVGIILRTGKNKSSFIWVLFNIAIATWGFGAFFIGRASDPSIALSWWQFAHIGIIFIPVFIFHVVTLICELNKRPLLHFVYAQAVIFSILNLSNPNFIFLSGVRYAFSSFYYGTLGVAYHAFFILWVSIVVYAHYQLFVSYFRLSGIKRIQIRYFLSSTILGFIGGGTNFIAAYQFKIFPFGNFAIPLYSVFITYAVLKYRLLDTSIVFTRTGIFVAVYSVVLGIPFALAFGLQDELMLLFGSSWWIVPLISSTVLATAGPFIYLYIQKKAEDKLLKEQRQYQTTLRQASMGMGQIKDLKRLLQLIVHIVTRAVSVEHCKIFLMHEESKQLILKASRGKQSGDDEVSVLALDCPLINHLKKIKEPVVYEEIKQQAQDYKNSKFKPIEIDISKVNGALVAPSFIDQKLIALLVLGKKKSGELYTQDDLAVFSILANQAGLAIENAQFYERMKVTHMQLLKAEKMATVGTMADGLSHQINNRLHAMGFIAGDALDTIRLKREKKLSKDMKAFLDEIERSFSRIEDNVKRGGEVVEGLL